MTTELDAANEIKSWLKELLKRENLSEFSVKIIGNSEKGDGYIGDIVFVLVTGLTSEKTQKEYNLVLKSSKRSAILRQKSPVKEAFLNEIYFYNSVYPSFVDFQKTRNVVEPFDNVPKCYGTLIGDSFEVLALDNLKALGYVLWDKQKPLTRKHVEIVIRNYAKFHAISVAMEDQQPQQFQKLSNGLSNTFGKLLDMPGMIESFTKAANEAYLLLKEELEPSIIAKWKLLVDESYRFFAKIKDNQLDGLKVILHGDNWSNNFMHYHINEIPQKTMLLDWQITRLSSPILDLSFFLFSCISKEDIDDLQDILLLYHKTFSNFLQELGTDTALYPLDSFLNEWQKYAKMNLIFVSLIHKYCLSDGKDDLPDIAKTAESGDDIGKAFSVDVGDTTAFKNRMKYLVESAAKNKLI